MKFKHTLLFLLISISCFAQVDVHIPNTGNAATREWVKIYLDEWLSRVPPPTTNPPVDTIPGVGACPSGPIITSIANITSTSIRVSATGSGVTSVNYSIYKMPLAGQILKSGNVPTFTSPFNIAWAGELAPAEYILRLDGVNCSAYVTQAFTISTTTPIPCTSSPVITSINAITPTGLWYSFAGLNVKDIVWSIKQNGATVRSGSTTPGANSTIAITYTNLAYGTYQLELTGIGCPNASAPMSFTIVNPNPNPIATDRHIYMNFTGYGFDPNDPTGLAPEWRERAEAFLNLSWQGSAFKGIGGIRLNMKWWEYETSEGVFLDSKIIAAINWCAIRGIRLSICYVPWRKVGDNMFADADKSTLVSGAIWQPDLNTYQPSVHSALARQKFKNSVRHLAQILAQYPNNVDYISCVTAQTEEYQLVRQENPLLITGYSTRDLEAWATYSNNASVPRPANHSDVGSIEAMMSTTEGRKWYEFQSQGLRDFHAAFVQGVREGGLRSCGMYAGAGAPSAVYDFTFKLNAIFSAGTSDQPDIVYSSEGDAGSQQSKLMATDVNAGTFPGADLAIEFDPEDVAANQIHNPPYGIDLNGNWLYEYGSSFFRRGGKIIHFAMSFKPDKIPQLTEALWKLKNEFIDTSMGMTGMPQGTPVVYPIPQYTGLQGYRYNWSANGGGLNQQVKVTIQ